MNHIYLTQQDFDTIESVYNIRLPHEFKKVYSNTGIDASAFYKWHDFSEDNVAFLRHIIHLPKEMLIQELDDIIWLEEWGVEPVDKIEKKERILNMIHQAPNLIPIVGHRYIAESEHDISPVLSIMGLYIIYYSPNLTDFVTSRGQYSGIRYIADYVQIPFWTEMMEQ